MAATRKVTIIEPGKVTRRKNGKLRYHSVIQIEAGPKTKPGRRRPARPAPAETER